MREVLIIFVILLVLLLLISALGGSIRFNEPFVQIEEEEYNSMNLLSSQDMMQSMQGSQGMQGSQSMQGSQGMQDTQSMNEVQGTSPGERPQQKFDRNTMVQDYEKLPTEVVPDIKTDLVEPFDGTHAFASI